MDCSCNWSHSNTHRMMIKHRTGLICLCNKDTVTFQRHETETCSWKLTGMWSWTLILEAIESGRGQMVHAAGWVGGRKQWLDGIQSPGRFIFNGNHKILMPSHSYSVDLTQHWCMLGNITQFTLTHFVQTTQMELIINTLYNKVKTDWTTQGSCKNKCLPLTCQMLTIFSMAEAKYFPVTLHARGDKQGSLGDPKPDMASSEEPSLKTQIRPKHQLCSFRNIWYKIKCIKGYIVTEYWSCLGSNFLIM